MEETLASAEEITTPARYVTAMTPAHAQAHVTTASQQQHASGREERQLVPPPPAAVVPRVFSISHNNNNNDNEINADSYLHGKKKELVCSMFFFRGWEITEDRRRWKVGDEWERQS